MVWKITDALFHLLSETLASGVVVPEADLDLPGWSGTNAWVRRENGNYEVALAGGEDDAAGVMVQVAETAGMLALMVVVPKTWGGKTSGGYI